MSAKFTFSKMVLFGLSVLLGVALLAACAQIAPMPIASAQEEATEPESDVTAAELEAQINAVWEEYGNSINTGDVDSWVALWAEGGMQLPPGEMPVEGIENLQAMRTAGASMFDFDMAVNNLEVGHGPEYAFARGFYSAEVSPKEGEGSSTIDGKYMTILQQQADGTWKLYRDCYNSNVPPAAAAEPDMEAVAAEVQAFWDEYARTNVARDLEGWINLWDEAGVKMIYGHTPIVGRDAVYDFKSAASEKLDVTSMSIHNQDVELSGNLATVRGIYEGVKTPKDGSAPIIIDGWYASVLKRNADGNWKLLWDTCASNVPPVAAAESDLEAVTAEINELFTEYGASLGAGDADRWIQLWVEDGVQLPPDASPNVGRDTIYESISGAMQVFAFEDMQIDVEEVLLAGDFAIARGMYTVTYVPHDGSESIFVDGKYTTTFQRQPDGSLKIYRDIFNSNVPPQ